MGMCLSKRTHSLELRNLQEIEGCEIVENIYRRERGHDNMKYLADIECPDAGWNDPKQMLWSGGVIVYENPNEETDEECVMDSRMGDQPWYPDTNTGHISVANGVRVQQRVNKRSPRCQGAVLFYEYMQCCEL